MSAIDRAENQTTTTTEFDVTDEIIIAPGQSDGWGIRTQDGLILAERSSSLSQAVIPVELGQAEGSRVLRFELETVLDETDSGALLEDQLLVYLTDSPTSTQMTLLDAGDSGTALFSIAGNDVDFVPGLVSYDGSAIEIDVTSLGEGGDRQGYLVFQLLNHDGDIGTRIQVSNLSNTVDPEGAERPFFPLSSTAVRAGASLNEDTDECDECEASESFTSQVQLDSGAVIETHDLVSYQSQGQRQGLRLTYDSLRADPRPILSVGGSSQFSAGLVLADMDLDGDKDVVRVSRSNAHIHRNTLESISGNAAQSLGGTSYTYDETFNQVTSVTDELGRQTLYEIDAVTGQRVSMTQVVGVLDSAENGETDDVVTRYRYIARGVAAAGQMDTKTDALGRVTDYDYDSLGRLERVTYAKGTVDEAVESYAYDAAGNRTVVIDANGNRTEYTYYDGTNWVIPI